ncbi:MAG: rhombosortase [Nevskiales bacterium]|nr:rhombosortase [Nevskiales bacterium]
MRTALRFDRAAIAAGEIWRFISGNFVHLGWWHLFLNELGLLVLVLLCPERLSWTVWVRRVLMLSAGVSLALYGFAPTQSYVGLSGVLHGLFMLGLGRQLLQQKDLIAGICLVYLIGKIVWEMIAGVPVSDEAALGGRVLVESHLYGTLSALGYGLLFGAFTGVETFRRQRKQQ